MTDSAGNLSSISIPSDRGCALPRCAAPTNSRPVDPLEAEQGLTPKGRCAEMRQTGATGAGRENGHIFTPAIVPSPALISSKYCINGKPRKMVLSKSVGWGALPKLARCAVKSVSWASGYPIDVLRGPARHMRLLVARMIVVSFLRGRGFSLSRIGDVFNRDHTTVLNAIKTAEAYGGQPDSGFWQVRYYHDLKGRFNSVIVRKYPSLFEEDGS